MRKPHEPTQQELVVIASEEDGFTKKRWMLVNSSEQERSVMLVEEALHRVAKNLPHKDLSKDL